MKTSGNKISLVISAAILGSMLIVPVLPASRYSKSNELAEIENEVKTVGYDSSFDTSKTSVGLSIGRELSIGL